MLLFLSRTGLPLLLCSSAIFLAGCDQTSDLDSSENSQVKTSDQSHDVPASDAESKTPQSNWFYLIRDIADLQLKVGEDMQKLQQTQTQLENALKQRDPETLQKTVETFKTQLTNFNAGLHELQLKSPEIENLRQKLITSNQQILDSDVLQHQLNLKKEDIAALQKQLASLHTDILKLTTLLLNPPSDKSSTSS